MGSMYVTSSFAFASLTSPCQFDPECSSFVLAFSKQSVDAFCGTPNFPGLYAAQQLLVGGGSHTSDFSLTSSRNPLLSNKLPSYHAKSRSAPICRPRQINQPRAESGNADEALLELNRKCGVHSLQKKKNIFTTLQRNVNKENNAEEQHPIDMLCMR